MHCTSEKVTTTAFLEAHFECTVAVNARNSPCLATGVRSVQCRTAAEPVFRQTHFLCNIPEYVIEQPCHSLGTEMINALAQEKLSKLPCQSSSPAHLSFQILSTGLLSSATRVCPFSLSLISKLFAVLRGTRNGSIPTCAHIT